MRYRLAIFDFDGTLADTLPFFTSVLDQVTAAHGLPRVDPETLESLRRASAREALRQLSIPLWKVPRLARSFRQMMAERAETIALFPGVPEVLRQLADDGVTLALVTSNSLDNALRILGDEAGALFRHTQCGTALFGKAARLRKVLAATGIPARDAIAIGDELRDLEAAQAAGIAFGAVGWGYTSLEALRAAAPAEVFTTPAEIAKNLRRLR